MTEYISPIETAKLVRKALKREFPSTKFSVRTDQYSGGSSIRVNWADGPTQSSVTAVAKAYQGGGFDGMIDMQYRSEHWLMPDGTVFHAYCEGTGGSMGSVPGYDYPQPHPDAKRVSLGDNFIFCDRNVTDRWVGMVKAAYAKLTPNERFALLDKTSTPLPVTETGGYSLEDPELSAYRDEASRVFYGMGCQFPDRGRSVDWLVSEMTAMSFGEKN